MNKLKEKFNLNNSFYVQTIKDNKNLIICSIVLALICTFISYPGIWYSDSYSRVGAVNVVYNCAWKVVTGHRSEIVASSWITIVPSFFMAACKLITGNIASYTCLQAFVFFLLTFIFIKELDAPYKKLQYVLFAFSPMIFCVSVYYEAGVGCVSGIIALIILLRNSEKIKYKFDKIIEFLLIVLSSFVIFGYRANAFTIIPVIIIYIFTRKYINIRKIATATAVFIGLFLVSALPMLLKINTMSSVSAGFAWEIITTIQRLEPEKQELYKDYLDEVGGEGSTQIAIQSSNENSVIGFLIGEGINMDTLSMEGSFSTILKKYLEIIIKEPATYFSMKWDFTKRTLGIDYKIACVEYDYNRWDRMEEYGFNDCIQREYFVYSYIKTNEVLGFYTCRPWFVYLISTILVTITWLQKDKKRELYVFSLLIAIFYYAAYIINTQSFELRYFYPSLYLMMILDVAIGMKLFKQIIDNIKNGKIKGHIRTSFIKIKETLKIKNKFIKEEKR